MNEAKNAFILGMLFVVASMLTFLAYKVLWATEWYWGYLSVLGIISATLAIRFLIQKGLKLWPVVGVILGLMIGQWWLVEALILQVTWSLNGFVP